MARARWGDGGYALTQNQLNILKDLYDTAFQIEQDWNTQCQKILFANATSINTEHGFYIKEFYRTYYQPNTSTYTSNTVYNNFLAKYSEQLYEAASEGITEEDALDIGLTALYQELEKNLTNKKFSFAKGNYSEMRVFNGLMRSFKQMASANDDIMNISLKDTAPRDFGDSVKYDMLLTIELEQDRLDLPIEVKKNIAKKYQNSKFDLGSFSDTGFSIKKNKEVYQDLIKSLQEDFKTFLNTSTSSTKATEEWVQKQLIDWSIQYIQWRLKNNFPIFVTDNHKEINLSSEIIRGFTGNAGNPGGHVEYIIKDMLKFVDLSNSWDYNGVHGAARYVYDDKGAKKRILEKYLQDGEWTEITSYPSDAKKAFERTTITPLFKATVWYGSK